MGEWIDSLLRDSIIFLPYAPLSSLPGGQSGSRYLKAELWGRENGLQFPTALKSFLPLVPWSLTVSSQPILPCISSAGPHGGNVICKSTQASYVFHVGRDYVFPLCIPFTGESDHGVKSLHMSSPCTTGYGSYKNELIKKNNVNVLLQGQVHFVSFMNSTKDMIDDRAFSHMPENFTQWGKLAFSVSGSRGWGAWKGFL